MPPTMATTEEALRFFGLGNKIEELERIVVEYDLDADFDDAGELILVDVGDVKEALFEEHKRNIGYRPDDPVAMAREKRNAERREKSALERRIKKRTTLEQRVTARMSEGRKRRWRLRRRSP